MTMMNEQELDALIRTSLERQEILETINQEVMQEVRHGNRRQRLRSWLRIAAFAFGMPLIFLCFLFGIYNLYTHTIPQPYIIIAIILSSVTMLCFCIKEINIFSVREV